MTICGKRIKAEQQAIYEDSAALMKAGSKPSDPKAMDIRTPSSFHRSLVYPCSHAMHVGLASLYEGDSRFAENIDKHGKGLTGFLVAAIRGNAKRNAA